MHSAKMKKYLIAFLLVCLFAFPASSAQDVVEVDSAESFVNAIASGATIRIKPGRYDISEAAGVGSGSVVEWADTGDGAALTIKGVRDLTIEGGGASNTELVTSSSGAEVLAFEGCENITIKGVSLGHVPADDIQGWVLTFSDVAGVILNDVEIRGVGEVFGLHTSGVSDLKATDLVTSELGTLLTDTINAAFTGATFSIDSGNAIAGGGDVLDGVTFDRCTFEHKRLRSDNGELVPTIGLAGGVKLVNVKVKDSEVVTEDDPCEVEELFSGGVELANVTIRKK